MKKGFGKLQVYTGNGKGKTTAALGLAYRASGHGYRTGIFCFMKGDIEYGEVKASALNDSIDLFQLGRETFVDKDNPDPVDVEMAVEGLKKAREALAGGVYDIVILDEVNVAVDFGLFGIEEVMEMLNKRSGGVEVICTGRNAPAELMEAADLVTEMKEVKHYYAAGGLHSRKGIEL